MRIKSLLLMMLLFLLYGVILPAETAKNISRTTISTCSVVNRDTISFYTGTSLGILIPAGQSIEFLIPEAFANRLPNFARIRHRKDRVFMAENAWENDPDSPWLSVQFHNPETDKWVTWQDQFGSKKRSAATSPFTPKQNTLYNFPEYVGKFAPDRIRVYNSGEGDLTRAVASLHGLELHYLTADNDDSQSRIFNNHTRVNSITLRFSLDPENGIEIKPDESFVFEFPEEFCQREILQVILKHRKDPAYAIDPLNPDTFDPNAAYILCEAHSSLNNCWYKWADRSSIAKFSEVRPADNAENETLHNCLRTFGTIKPDRFRLTNVGTGDPNKAIANIHELEIMFMPAKTGELVIEKIFTPETAFSNIAAGKPVPLLGGGPRLNGRFPEAVLLGKNRADRFNKLQQLPEEHYFTVDDSQSSDGNFRIELPHGCRIEIIEIAMGDLDLTSLEANKDGYFGRSGHAQASISIERSDATKILLKERNNIGMAGFITCGGPADDELTRPGDHLLIEVLNDEAFLMGYRVILSPAS